MTEPSDFLRWPEAPADQRPKSLFHAGLVTPEAAEALQAKGWQPIDVRSLPNKTDIDRAEALKDWLEGVRLGTIEPDKSTYRFVELEARVYGLAQGKSPSGKRSNTPVDTPDTSQTYESVLNSFGKSNNNWSSTAEQKAALRKKKIGRPTEEGEG